VEHRMHRTQVYLDEDLDQALGELARLRGTSKAGLIRLAARRLLVEEREKAEEDPILGLSGLGHGGPGHASADHGRILADYALGPRQK
jgi:predicted transcriptional regulator